MGKKKKINFIIPLILFPYDVMFSAGESDKELIAELDRRGIKDRDYEIIKYGNGCARCVMLDGGQTIIRLKSIPEGVNDLSILAHEIFHATELIMRRMDIKLSESSDEVYAYTIQYLTQKIYEKIFISS